MESSSTEDAIPDYTGSTEPAPESTAGLAKTIQAIDKTSVHRICSGQVVLNLATAVKELVENSVDAGATSIEVRLKDYGSELIEVVDNGSGVEESNFQALTLKHHTSKLQDFSDLTSVDTFGFRGEALSSLCALSKLVVTTRREKATVGHKLEYEHSGKLLQQTPCARQKGTTVTLQNIFSTLPVRHKEFSRNLKKEFAKMVQVLSAYCIVTTAVKITCTNQLGKGKKNVVVNTVGNDTIKENITNIFGPKQMQSLLEFEQSQLPSEETSTEYNIKVSQPDGEVFKVIGYVSSSEHGHGRSSTDRQFYYINHRPCDFFKVSRLVNEVYHMFNRHQYPFVVLDISLCKESVDVNVTPDKRQIFIQHEKLLLAIIKTSLMKMFEPRSALVPMNMTQSLHSSQTGTGSMSSSFSRKSLSTSPGKSSPFGKQQSCPQLPEKKTLTSTLANLKRSFSSAFAKEQSGTAVEQSPKDQKQRRLDSFISTSARSPSNSASFQPSSSSDELGTPPVQKDHLEDAGPFSSSNTSPCSAKDSAVSMDEDSGPWDNQEPHLVCIIVDRNETVAALNTEQTLHSTSIETSSTKLAENDRLTNSNEMTAEKDCDAVIRKTMTPIQTSPDSVYDDNSPTSPQKSPGTAAVEDPTVTFTELDSPEEKIERKAVTVSFSMNAFRERISNKKKHQEKSKEFCRSFRAKINPADNQSAENELKKEISKDMFSKMQILGQFNLGFIIGKLGSDLFIIDQHATDEKYNFEMLQRHTVIQSQKLICPQDLELTAVNETILMDNLDIFEKNGFKFSINEDAPPTRRIRLASKPVSKNWEFGKQDIEELIFMLSDTPGVMCRPSRIRQMFASRSCRKAIMIGTALSSRQMRQLVDHMGEIEQPWNCPHGRPTMRHLINMNMLPS